jgi:hypothetical protein
MDGWWSHSSRSWPGMIRRASRPTAAIILSIASRQFSWLPVAYPIGM